MRQPTEVIQRIFILFGGGMMGIMLVFGVVHVLTRDWLFLATNIWILLISGVAVYLAARRAYRTAAQVVLIYGSAGATAAMLIGTHFYAALFPVADFIVPFLMTNAILAGAFLTRRREVGAAMSISAAALALHVALSVQRDSVTLVEAVSMVTFVLIAVAGAVALHLARSRLLAETDRAQEHAKAQESLLSTMSHELRTPLSAISGLTDLLNTEASMARRQEYGEYLRGAVDHLGTLVDDILDYHKLKAGHLEVRNDTFTPEQTLQGVVSLFSPRAQSMGLVLSTAANTCGHWVRGDETRIRQVLHNLVDNALKYTEAGEVVVACSLSHNGEARDTGVESWLRFDVCDTGRGIAEEDRDRIFDVFAQVRESHVRERKGTGLGLPICRKIVEAMGGSIDFSSVRGEGSCFWFTVPTLRIPPELVSIPRTTDTDTPREGLRVLLAEDEKANALVACRMLEHLGHSVETARDGATALAKILSCEFDAALIDIHMPEIDGVEVIRRVRKLEAEQRYGNHRLPIISLTAYAGDAERELVLAAGADAILRKPFRQSDLQRVLGHHAGTNLVSSLR